MKKNLENKVTLTHKDIISSYPICGQSVYRMTLKREVKLGEILAVEKDSPKLFLSGYHTYECIAIEKPTVSINSKKELTTYIFGDADIGARRCLSMYKKYMKRGRSGMDIWNFDTTFVNFMILKLENSHFYGIIHSPDDEYYNCSYDVVIKDIIKGYKQYLKYAFDPYRSSEAIDALSKSNQLLAKYLPALWN